MLKARGLLAASLLVLLASPAALGADLQGLKQRYVRGLFRARPHLGSFLGDHQYEGLLPDWSAEAFKRREQELQDIARELPTGPRVRVSGDDAIDLEILRGGVALELLYLRDLRPWEWDPRLVDTLPAYGPREIVTSRVAALVQGDWASDADRRVVLRTLLEGIPPYLAQVRAALKQVSKEHLVEALNLNRARLNYFDADLKAFTAKDPATEMLRVKAVAALRGYQKFLESDAPKLGEHGWRLGAALYRRAFPLVLQTATTADQAGARAAAAMRQVRTELFGAARRLHKQMWPAEPAPAGADPKSQARVIRRVLDELSKDHPKVADVVAAPSRYVETLRAFIWKGDTFRVAPPESLRFVAPPAWSRGAFPAAYQVALALDVRAPLRASFAGDGPDPLWPAAKVELYLRDRNVYAVQLGAMRASYPGKHTLALYARAAKIGPLRLALASDAMIEGWSLLAQGLMVQEGWGAQINDRFRFFDLREQLAQAAGAVADARLHEGTMAPDEAMRFLVDEAFDERPAAEIRVRRMMMEPAAAAAAFVGWEEMRALDRDVRRKAGAKARPRDIHEALLAHGPVAPRLLRRLLLGAK